MIIITFVCVYVFFIPQPQQHQSKPKNTVKADKKEAVKNDDVQTIHCTDITKVIIICMLTAPFTNTLVLYD